MAPSNSAKDCETGRALETLSLPEALVLATYGTKPERGWLWEIELGLGAAGALLLELALADRIVLDPDNVEARGVDTTGDALLDRTLALVVGRPGREPVAWVHQLAPWVLPSMRQRLVIHGLLLCRPSRRLWIIPADDYLVDPARSMTSAVAHLRMCAHDEPRSVALATLMVAAHLFPASSAPSAISATRTGWTHRSPERADKVWQSICAASTAVTMAITGAASAYAPPI